MKFIAQFFATNANILIRFSGNTESKKQAEVVFILSEKNPHKWHNRARSCPSANDKEFLMIQVFGTKKKP